MDLIIDGLQVTTNPGQTILELVQQLGLDRDNLVDKPLAAKIAGEIFNLNYIPVRPKDVISDQASVRRAIAASAGNIKLLRFSDPAGKDVYTRTAWFVLFLALHRLWPNARAKMNCTLGNALYIAVCDRDFSTDALKHEVQRIINANIPLIRHRTTCAEAENRYCKTGRTDVSRLLSWRTVDYFDEYSYETFSDYYYGELAPSTGYVQVWNILPAEGGFIFLFPDDQIPDTVAPYQEMPNFLKVSTEGEHWCELMGCETVADLNELVRNGNVRELIRVNEALHEKQFAQVADEVCAWGAKAVMLAGPSSSGKTTSANRLATQLKVHGMKPIIMSLDDYYIDRDLISPEPDGTLDLEHINTIDTDLFREHIESLLRGDEIELPSFNFKTGHREWHGHKLSLSEKSVLIVEGLHALNPILLPRQLDTKLVFKLYVSPLIPLNLDDHNRIPTTLLRLLRRTVRDYETRGASVQKTMQMWDSVRRGEKRWIYPFQENADYILNSSTLYELAVLKKHIFPLLTAIAPEEDCYETVRAIVKVLNYVLEADVDDEIPPTSLVREFIGGNSFYR